MTVSKRLCLSLLGKLQIEYDGRSVVNGLAVKEQALLAYLAMRGEPCPRDELADLLWGDVSPKKARTSLRVALAGLRKRLPDALDLTADRVAFDDDVDLWLDVAAFRAAVAADGSVDALQPILDLYRGHFLADFNVDAAVRYQEWVQRERARLQREASHAFLLLAEILLAAAEPGEAARVLRHCLTLDPWDENAHRQLMRALSHTGDFNAALAQYERCRRLLEEELGVQPEPETTALYERIRAARRGVPHNLPPESAPLVGREQELQTLVRALGNRRHQAVTLVGLGGIGKTRLALAAARRLLAGHSLNYLEGIFFVPLAGVHSISALPAAIAGALRLSLAGQVEPGRELINHLRDKEMLLILDNFEQLLAGVYLLKDLLANCPGVSLLVTSREPLPLLGARRISVDGLSYPGDLPEDDEKPAASAATFAAVRLFIQTARQTSPTFRLTDANVHHVVRLCQLVGGVPLALKLAAAWLRVMPVDLIAAEIARNLDILTSDVHDLPPRQRSMRAVFQQTWALLLPEEQEALQALAVFHSGFDAAAAAEVTGVEASVLADLVERGLVQSAGAARFALHPLIRTFAAAHLDQAGLEQALAGRHSRYFLRYLAQREAALHGETPQDAIAALQAELDNVRQAWQRAVDQAWVDPLAAAVEALAAFYESAGLLMEGERVFATAVASFDAHPPAGGATSLLCHLLLKHVVFLLARGKDTEVEAGLARATLLAWQLQNERHLAESYYLRGLASAYAGDAEQAIVSYRRAVSLYRDGGQPWQLAAALNMLGEALSRQQRTAEALICHRQALRAGAAAGDRREQALSLSHIGVAYYFQGDYDTALAHWERAASTFEQLHDLRGLGRTLNNLAYVHNLLGRYEEGLPHAERAVRLLRQIGDRRNEAAVADTCGNIHVALGAYERARDYFRQALRYAREMELPVDEALFLTNLSLLDVATGRYDAAGEQLRRALALIQEGGHPSEIARTVGALGRLHHEMGRLGEALDAYDQALDLLGDVGARHERAQLLVLKGHLLLEAGNVEAAAVAAEDGVRAAQTIGHTPLLFQADLLAARVEHARGRTGEAVHRLRTLSDRAAGDAEAAAVHYELWRTGQEPDSAERAHALYRRLAERTPAVSYQQRWRELQGALAAPE